MQAHADCADDDSDRAPADGQEQPHLRVSLSTTSQPRPAAVKRAAIADRVGRAQHGQDILGVDVGGGHVFLFCSLSGCDRSARARRSTGRQTIVSATAQAF